MPDFLPEAALSGPERTKWEFLRDAWQRDRFVSEVQLVAKGLRLASFGNMLRFARLCLCYAQTGIKYQSDTERAGGEDVAGFVREGTKPPPPGDNIGIDIRRGTDDCDLKARLFVALCRSQGLEAEMLPVIEIATAAGPVLTHVRARVCIHGKWYSAEPSLARARLGEVPTDVPREISDGKWAR